MNSHIVLIGMNFSSQRSSGDKNFWVDLLPILAQQVERISIISIRNQLKTKEELMIENCFISIEYLTPKLLESPDIHYSRKRLWKEGSFPTFWGIVEKTLNIRRVIRVLNEINKNHPYRQIHLMDNFGHGNRAIANHGMRSNIAVSVSAITYQGKNPIFYHPYLNWCYSSPNLVVIPYSAMFYKKLIELKISPNNIKHIPWGVKISELDLSAENILSIKNKFAEENALSTSAKQKPLFMWTGYIQQIQRPDFLYALKQARIAIERGLAATFFFAFKSECFESEFKAFHQPNQGIYVQPTTIKQYELLQKAADIFYSPVVNKRSIITPPLTWLEMLALGKPILTTSVPGVRDCITQGITGYIASTGDELIEYMSKLSISYPMMLNACIEKVKKDYDINTPAKEYLKLWF